MREESVERHLQKSVKAVGGLCVKLNPAGVVGIPDRLVLLPGGVVVFTECKKPKGAVVAKLQCWWRDKLLELGMYHAFVHTKQDVAVLMETYQT